MDADGKDGEGRKGKWMKVTEQTINNHYFQFQFTPTKATPQYTSSSEEELGEDEDEEQNASSLSSPLSLLSTLD